MSFMQLIHWFVKHHVGVNEHDIVTDRESGKVMFLLAVCLSPGGRGGGGVLPLPSMHHYLHDYLHYLLPGGV